MAQTSESSFGTCQRGQILVSTPPPPARKENSGSQAQDEVVKHKYQKTIINNTDLNDTTIKSIVTSAIAAASDALNHTRSGMVPQSANLLVPSMPSSFGQDSVHLSNSLVAIEEADSSKSYGVETPPKVPSAFSAAKTKQQAQYQQQQQHQQTGKCHGDLIHEPSHLKSLSPSNYSHFPPPPPPKQSKPKPRNMPTSPKQTQRILDGGGEYHIAKNSGVLQLCKPQQQSHQEQQKQWRQINQESSSHWQLYQHPTDQTHHQRVNQEQMCQPQQQLVVLPRENQHVKGLSLTCQMQQQLNNQHNLYQQELKQEKMRQKNENQFETNQNRFYQPESRHELRQSTCEIKGDPVHEPPFSKSHFLPTFSPSGKFSAPPPPKQRQSKSNSISEPNRQMPRIRNGSEEFESGALQPYQPRHLKEQELPTSGCGYYYAYAHQFLSENSPNKNNNIKGAPHRGKGHNTATFAPHNTHNPSMNDPSLVSTSQTYNSSSKDWGRSDHVSSLSLALPQHLFPKYEQNTDNSERHGSCPPQQFSFPRQSYAPYSASLSSSSSSLSSTRSALNKHTSDGEIFFEDYNDILFKSNNESHPECPTRPTNPETINLPENSCQSSRLPILTISRYGKKKRFRVDMQILSVAFLAFMVTISFVIIMARSRMEDKQVYPNEMTAFGADSNYGLDDGDEMEESTLNSSLLNHSESMPHISNGLSLDDPDADELVLTGILFVNNITNDNTTGPIQDQFTFRNIQLMLYGISSPLSDNSIEYFQDHLESFIKFYYNHVPTDSATHLKMSAKSESLMTQVTEVLSQDIIRQSILAVSVLVGVSSQGVIQGGGTEARKSSISNEMELVSHSPANLITFDLTMEYIVSNEIAKPYDNSEIAERPFRSPVMREYFTELLSGRKYDVSEGTEAIAETRTIFNSLSAVSEILSPISVDGRGEEEPAALPASNNDHHKDLNSLEEGSIDPLSPTEEPTGICGATFESASENCSRQGCTMFSLCPKGESCWFGVKCATTDLFSTNNNQFGKNSDDVFHPTISGEDASSVKVTKVSYGDNNTFIVSTLGYYPDWENRGCVYGSPPSNILEAAHQVHETKEDCCREHFDSEASCILY